MPFKSKKQKRTIDAAAHNPEFAKKIGIKMSDAKKMSKHGKGQTKFEEAVDTVEKDEKGNVKSWKHEGDWKKADKKNPRGKVTHMSDVARRKTEKLSKAEEDMNEAFAKALEGKDMPVITQGPNKGKQWSSKNPGPTNPDYKPFDKTGVPSPDDGATAPPPKAKSIKKAEVSPVDIDDQPEVAEGKQTYGGKGKKKTKSEHDAEVKKKKEKEKFNKIAETMYKIGRLEQMIVEAKKAKKDYDGDGKVETEKDEVWGSRMKAAKKAGKMEEAAKPDFLDMDKDGDKKEPMKKAVKDKAKGKKVEEAKKEKEPEGLYSKKRFETDSQRVARLAKEKRQAEKKKKEEKVDEAKAKCTCEEDGKSKCAVHGKKKDTYMESLFIKLQNQLNG